MTKWILAIAILIGATVATGGLDLVAVALALAVFAFFRQATK